MRRKEQVILQMSKDGELVAEHDITTYTQKELLALVRMQRKLGRTSNIKRVWREEPCQSTEHSR